MVPYTTIVFRRVGKIEFSEKILVYFNGYKDKTIPKTAVVSLPANMGRSILPLRFIAYIAPKDIMRSLESIRKKK